VHGFVGIGPAKPYRLLLLERRSRPYAGYGFTAKFTFAIRDIIFCYSITDPSDNEFFALRAIGIFADMAGDIAYVNVIKP